MLVFRYLCGAAASGAPLLGVFGATALAAEAFEAPKRFALEASSPATSETAPAFFPGDRDVIFQRSEGDKSELRRSRRRGQGWSAPVTLPFSGQWRDLEPAVSADGSYVIFASSRPFDGGSIAISGRWGAKDWPGKGGNLWRADRRRDGSWTQPKRLPETVNRGTSVFEPALARDGTLFFMRPDDETNRFRLFAADPRNGYAIVRALDFWKPGTVDVDPAVALDQSYIVFASNRDTPGRLALFMSFQLKGRWSAPIRLPDATIGGASIQDIHLSADQTQLYFTRDNIIWRTPFRPILAWAKRTAANR